MRYVALLRGANAGGKRRVPKADFQSVLEGLGFRDVTVYINSGNAVFESEGAVDSTNVQVALEDYFGFAIPTLILAEDKVREIAEAIPDGWTNDALRPDRSGQKSDVIYLFDEVNGPEILNKFGYNPEIEKMIYVDGAVIASVTRKNQTKGSLHKLVGTKLYSQVTVRNVNTARKLAALL